MTPEKAAETRRSLINAMEYVSNELATFCKPYKGDMGLVSDECRQSPKYKQLSAAYQVTKDNLATFNKMHKSKDYQKAFKAETIEHFKQKRA